VLQAAKEQRRKLYLRAFLEMVPRIRFGELEKGTRMVLTRRLVNLHDYLVSEQKD